MNKSLKAVDGVRTLARGFQAVIDLAEEVERIGNFEQAAAEHQAAIAARKRELEEIDAQVKARREADAAEASTTVADAKAEAARIVEAAKAEAADVKARARANADKAEAAAKAATTRLAEINAEIDAARSNGEAGVKALTEQAEALEQRIAEARAAAAKLLG